MYYTVYVSTATELFTTSQLQSLVEKCNQNNTKLNITGMLLYNEGNFIQVLEGEKQIILDLYKIIEKDQRHNGMLKLSEGELEQRNFPDWSMGFKVISAIEYSKFSEVVSIKDRLTGTDGHSALTLLKSFSEL